MSLMWEIIGWVAAVVLVGGYTLVATRVLSAHSAVYHVLNLVGAIGLAFYSVYKLAWPQFALNAFWAVVAVIGVLVSIRAVRNLRATETSTDRVDDVAVREG